MPNESAKNCKKIMKRKVAGESPATTYPQTLNLYFKLGSGFAECFQGLFFAVVDIENGQKLGNL
jgi:hypothetical protein